MAVLGAPDIGRPFQNSRVDVTKVHGRWPLHEPSAGHMLALSEVEQANREGTVGQSRKSVIAIAAVVAIVAAGAALLIAGVGTATADEVRFQNVSDPGPAPFTAPTDVATTESDGSSSDSASSTDSSTETSSSESSTTESTESTTSESAGSPSAAGGSDGETEEEPKPGTFGGTGDNKVCDREKLIEELSQDPDKLSAWAEVAGVDATEEAVGSYIRELTPSTLTQDTQVTNHSYVGGEANAYQAILEKGTAVLVDEDGKPVARCRCGNPLSEPLQLEPETKCYQCAANYQPPPPCEGRCYRPVTNPPPVKPDPGKPQPPVPPVIPPGDVVQTAKDALEACRQAKGSLEACRVEYDKTRDLCAKDPLNKACDSTVCFEGALDVASDGCPTYLDRGVALEVCLKIGAQAEKNACLKRIDDLAKKCLADPKAADCTKDPKIKRVNLIGKCITTPSRPECAALQVDCAKNPSQFRCDALKGTCTQNPARPDCKAASEFLEKCVKTPTLPECKTVEPKKALPALKGEDEPAAQEGDQPPTGEEGSGEPIGEGTDTGGGDAGGGDTSGGDTGGGGETPAPEAEPETTPPPEGE